MKMSNDQLAQKLESALGAAAVQSNSDQRAQHAVDSTQPALVCFPDNPEQVAAALRACHEAEAAVVPWGGGTAMRIGNRPRKVDVAFGLHRVNRLIEHDHANLTVTVQSGMTLAALQDILAREKQFLAFDLPFPPRSTIGGTVAGNLNGPRRSFFGSVRDLVIGMKVALITGEQIKGGGKVVKNVAGYDMCKLFVGSLGTLGIITEVTIRVAPISEIAASLMASGDLSQALQFADDLSNSPLLPAAVVILNPAASRLHALQAEWSVAVWSEGFEETVARHLRDATTLAQRHGLRTEILRDNLHKRFWDRIRDFPLKGDGLVYRLTLPRASVAGALKAVQERQNSGWFTPIVTDAAAGTMWIASPAEGEGREHFSTLTALAREQRGHAILFAAPAELKEGIDVWGPAPPTLSSMKEIKRQFDRKGLLNPGRFVGGI